MVVCSFYVLSESGCPVLSRSRVMVGDDGVGSGRGVVDDDVGCKGYKGLIMVRDVVQLQEGRVYGYVRLLL